MASNNNIDYIEIDRILNNMFTPMEAPESQENNNYRGTSLKQVINDQQQNEGY